MSVMHASNIGLVTIGVLSLSLAGCSGTNGKTQQRAEPPANIKAQFDRLEQGQAKQKEVLAEYKAMQIPQLAQRLEGDSLKSVEPFNSLAYREVVSRGASVARELATFIKNPDQSSFLTLVAVRKIDQEAYRSIDEKTRAAILVDALRTSKNFNAWGLPHLYWEDAAKAIIENAATADGLRGLLRDQRAAPVWGGEEFQEYEKYRYRVCDYAWALLLAQQKRTIEIPVDPAARDRLIGNESGTARPPQ